MEEYFIIVAAGLFVAADITVFGQFMISQPLVSTFAAGVLLGYPEAALTIGIIMQCMWMKLVPAGGSVYLNGNLGSLAAFSVYALTRETLRVPEDSLIFCCLIYGIVSSYFFGLATVLQRKANQHFLPRVHEMVKNERFLQFQAVHFLGVLSTGIGGGVLVLLMSLFGTLLLSLLGESFYFTITGYSKFGTAALLGTGFGTMLSMIWERQALKFPAMGILAGIALIYIFSL